MANQIEEHRRRAAVAWGLIQADVARLKDSVSQEVGEVRQLSPRALLERYPLAFAGAAFGAAFLVGLRGGPARPAPEEAPPARGLTSRLLEAAALAGARRGASALAGYLAGRLEAAGRLADEPPPPIGPSTL